MSKILSEFKAFLMQGNNAGGQDRMGLELAPGSDGNGDVQRRDLAAFPHDPGLHRIAVEAMHHHQINQAP